MENEDEMCSTCAGSGEGMYADSTCRSCGGSGTSRIIECEYCEGPLNAPNDKVRMHKDCFRAAKAEYEEE